MPAFQDFEDAPPERSMPYATNEDLPPSVRNHLPPSAQSAYREAFNGAWNSYGLDPRREEIAHRVAWSAVKRHWHKAGSGNWEREAASYDWIGPVSR